MKLKKTLFIIFASILVILLIAASKFTSYRIYYYQQDDQYLNQVEESDAFNLVHTEDISHLSNYGGYTGTINYYKSIDVSNSDFDSYIVFVRLNVKPNNDDLTSTTDTYYTTEMLHVYSHVKENNPDVDLINHFFMSPQNKRSFKFNLSINHLLGKKDLSDAINEVGYTHQTNYTEGFYQGTFHFVDQVEERELMTYYVFEYPKSEEMLKNTVKITVNFKKTSPVFLFLKSNNTLRLEGEHEVEFNNS